MRLKVFILVLLLSSVSVFAQTKTDESLKSLVKRMTDAQINYQPDALDKIYTADFIEISPVGEFDPREKVLGFYKPELKPPADKTSTSVEATEFSIRIYGDTAIIITRLNFTITNEGKTSPFGMRATLVCRREKGAWKIASAQYTGIRPPRIAPKTE